MYTFFAYFIVVVVVDDDAFVLKITISKLANDILLNGEQKSFYLQKNVNKKERIFIFIFLRNCISSISENTLQTCNYFF